MHTTKTRPANNLCTADEIIQHVKAVNPNGVGRPYSIKKLVFAFGIRANKPKRLTDWMRLELDETLRRAGIGNDRVLLKQFQATKHVSHA